MAAFLVVGLVLLLTPIALVARRMILRR
jgi:hypothetical protein